MLHTRPVGQMRDLDLAARVRGESDSIMAEYGCRQVHTTYGAFGEDLKPLDLAPHELFAALVSGWQRLVDADPRVLAWLVDYQRSQLTIPEYPVEGTPNMVVDPASGARGGR